MSAYGLKVFRDDGSLFISPDVVPLNYIKKVQYYFNLNPYRISTGIPADRSIKFFIRTTTDEYGGAIVKPVNSGGYWDLEVSRSHGSGYIYLFANMVTKTSGYGVAVYNQSGQMTWNTDMIPLQLYSIRNPSGISDRNQIRIPVGFNVAVSPGLCSTYLIVVPPAAEEIRIIGGMICTGVRSEIVINTAWAYQSSGSISNPPTRYKENLLYINTDMYP